MTPRQEFQGILDELEDACPDTHLTVVKRWEDMLDTWPSGEIRLEIYNDIMEALENVRE